MPVQLIEGRDVATLQAAISAYITAQSIADGDLTSCSIAQVGPGYVAALTYVVP